jgi:hypothetical protein
MAIAKLAIFVATIIIDTIAGNWIAIVLYLVNFLSFGQIAIAFVLAMAKKDLDVWARFKRRSMVPHVILVPSLLLSIASMVTGTWYLAIVPACMTGVVLAAMFITDLLLKRAPGFSRRLASSYIKKYHPGKLDTATIESIAQIISSSIRPEDQDAAIASVVGTYP